MRPRRPTGRGPGEALHAEARESRAHRGPLAAFALACGLGLASGVVAAMPAHAAEDAPAVHEPAPPGPPPVLAGELLLFDLRRLELWRARADGTGVRQVEIDLGDSSAAGVAAGGVGAFAAYTGYAMTAGFNGIFGALSGGVVTVSVAPIAAASVVVLAGPAYGITKAIQVAQRHGRPVRSIGQVQNVIAVSATGDRLLFAKDVDGTMVASRMRLLERRGDDGNRTTVLRRFRFGGASPDLSPDGSEALVVASPRRKEAPEIYRMWLESGRIERLTSDGLPKSFPRWSPDGRRIAFQRWVPDEAAGVITTQIFVMDADGGNVRQLTHDAMAAVTPSWSADGASLAYASLADGAAYLVSRDGGAPRRIAPEGMVKLHPQLSADGELVMYMQSSHAAENLEAQALADGTPEKPGKPRLGKDFRLRVTRISDGATWPVELARGSDDDAKVIEKSNLFWFHWHQATPETDVASRLGAGG